jgi:hypothetical protein
VSGRSGDEDDEGDGAWAAAAVTENLDAAAKARKEEEDREENRRLMYGFFFLFFVRPLTPLPFFHSHFHVLFVLIVAMHRRLMSTFTDEQEHRYRMYKRSTLNKTQLKRIVNQTVSQSVTALPLIAIGAYSKFFVGEIVTRALDVQKEWAAAFERERERGRGRGRQEKQKDGEVPSKAGGGSKAPETKTGDARGSDAQADKSKFVPNPHKGGLLPDHLREALRRYKGDGEGGGVGFGSTSLGMMGTQGAGTWRAGNGGGARRLFR